MAGLSPEDFDYAVRTVWGEARGEPALGQQSVAAVIRNRARAANTGFKNVVLAPNQFEPWGSKRGQLMALSPQSPEYQRIADTIRPILESDADPTNGATHFYSPKVQAALGRKPPSWDNGTGFEIGTHRFFKLGAPTSAPAASPASAPITTGSIPGRPPMADFSTAGLSPEEVALRRRQGQYAYQQGTDASPVGHWTQALARVVQGANAGMWNAQAQEGESQGRKAMVEAIMSGNPKAVLGTQYGAAMAPQFLEQSIRQSDPMYQAQLRSAQDTNAHNAAMRPIQEQNAQLGLRHTQTMQPIQEDMARANLKKAQDKDAVQEFIRGIMAPDQGQPAINQQPQMRPMSDTTGGITSSDPNLIRVQATQPSAPPTTQKGIRDIIKSRPLAEQQMFAMMLGQDPKKAMDLLKEWTDPKINKTTEHDLDKGLMGAINSTSRLQEVQRQFKPEFLQGGSQATINFNTFRDKFLTGKLKPNPQELAQLNQYHTWRASAWNELNSYIKELAGSAVTGNELERTLRERPNPGTGWVDGDSPAAYEAKLNSTLRNGKMAIARYRYLRENGLLKEGEAMAKREDLGQKFPLDQMPKIIDQEGEKTLKRMRMENPGASDQKLLPKAMEEVSKRFGLSI